MKIKKDTDFKIAKGTIDTVFTKNESLDYDKWVEFVDQNKDHFLWKEETAQGKQNLLEIDKVPESFRGRVLASLNKGACFKEFDEKKGFYNINVSINKANNWISIGFERGAKPEDLKIFVEMAAYLDAYLLMDGTTIIDEDTLKELG